LKRDGPGRMLTPEADPRPDGRDNLADEPICGQSDCSTIVVDEHGQ
jgi:hypothetical protein